MCLYFKHTVRGQARHVPVYNFQKCPFPFFIFRHLTYCILVRYIFCNFKKVINLIFSRFRPTINWRTLGWVVPLLHIYLQPLSDFLLIILCQFFFKHWLLWLFNYFWACLVTPHPLFKIQCTVSPPPFRHVSPFLVFDYKPLFIINCNGKKFS